MLGISSTGIPHTKSKSPALNEANSVDLSPSKEMVIFEMKGSWLPNSSFFQYDWFLTKITSLEEELATAKGTNETLTGEVEALNAKINKADAKGTEIETDGDPVVVENKKEDANAGFYAAMASRVRNKFNN